MDRYPIPHPAILKEILRQERPFAPLTAMIHITEHCNVRCEFCWHHSFLKKDKHQPKRMETSAVIDIIQELGLMGTKDITLSANGEPTNHPGFSSIVKAIKNSGMRLKVVTNLTLFSPTIAVALAQADHLIINLAAVDPASYQSIYAPRGQVSFDQIINNIKTLARLQQHGGPQIKIGYVLTKNTFRQIAEVISLAEACRASSIRFKFMDPSSFTQSLMLDAHERQWLLDEITRNIKNPISITTNLRDILQTLSASTIKSSESKKEREHGRCFIGWLVMNINENGSVTLCCQNDHLIIGNWKEKPLREIWEGEKAREFRHSAKTKVDFNNPLWHACRGCHYSNPKHYSRRINQEFSQSSKT
jgi:MoaA/NifB/PqqE/SkfB family radical SAM enzyme